MTGPSALTRLTASLPALRPMPRPVAACPPEPHTACPSVLVHGCGVFSVRFPCTLRAPHLGQLHEHRPHAGRMATTEWV
ncbi:MAG TPA: hypothetical protein VGR26_14795 [Acidimicrobiales bacterium]|nr:hypothetical protein [Acidimicrobiales bacterium]